LLYSAISFAFFIVPVFIGTHRSEQKETRCENAADGVGGGKEKKRKEKKSHSKSQL